MFKGKIKKENRELLLELLKLMAESDGLVSEEEMGLILQIKKVYHMKNYEPRNLSKDDIHLELSQLDDETVLNILTHAALLALVDKEFNTKERALFLEFFDLLSLESAAKLQRFITMYGKEEFDIREFYENFGGKEEIFEESLVMMNELSDRDEKDIDESKLMKMNRGPLKKVWDQVLQLVTVIRSPKTDKTLKAIAIGALLYVILPFDVIPDLIPVLGLTDDVAVVSYAISQIFKRKGIS